MLESLKSLFTQININVRFIVFIVLSMIVMYVSSDIYNYKTKQFKDEVYLKLADNILQTTNILMKQKRDASLMLSIASSTNPLLADIVFGKPYVDLKLNQLSQNLNHNSNYDDIWFSVIDEYGQVVKRSWIDEHLEEKFSQLYEKPISLYTINKFGLMINSISPIKYDNDVIGDFDVITHFTSITDELKKLNFKSVIFLDVEKSKKVDIKYSVSKKFIGDAYVVNKNADELSIKIIFNRGIEFYEQFKQKYFVDDRTNSFETVYILKDDNGKTLAYMVLMYPLDEIDMGELANNQQIHIYMTIFIILGLGLVIYYRNSYVYVNALKEENQRLAAINATLNEKNDELDFNEKRIANMFYVQPNFMVLSDGKSIENVNERMIWLLNASKENGLKEIQERYKCISEVFEESDDKSIDLSEYIYEDTIEGQPWKDYMLSNFKRNYKTCIRNPFGKQHHFVIKINEMKYAKLSKRYIVISFIDITKEIEHTKKMQQELDKALKTIEELKKQKDTQ